MNDIMVSIDCITYNHEKYIEDCIKGLLNQETDFNYEILIYDDASTDRTPEIIRKYAKQYPDIIKPILQTENQYSKNVPISATFQHPRIKGKYYAICEGDDYWTDPHKLQLQVDALEARPEINICAHAAEIRQSGKRIGEIAPQRHSCIIPTEEVIKGGGAFVATNSIMLRVEQLFKRYKFVEKLWIDYSIQILGALGNGMLYLDRCMSVYNYLNPGSWTQSLVDNREKIADTHHRLAEMLEMLNIETEFKFDGLIRNMILFHEFERHDYLRHYKLLKQEPLLERYKKLPIIQKLRISIRALRSSD